MRYVLAVLVLASTTPLSAQLAIPAVPVLEADSVTFVSAAEMMNHIRLKESLLEHGISIRQLAYPKDSMLAVKVATAAGWLAQLKAQPVHGTHLDPAGYVGANATDVAYAQAQIAERLATRGLTREERAFTLLAAVRAFANSHYPERLPAAEAYLRQLDAVGDSAFLRRFEAREALVKVYSILGRSDDVVRHGSRAIELVGSMEFIDRGEMFGGGAEIYAMTALALTGMSDGPARLRTLNARLQVATIPAAAVVATDSAFLSRSRWYQESLRQMQLIGNLVGDVGRPLMSNYWLNRPTRDSASIPVNDGKIRVVETMFYGCPTCLLALHGLQRIKDAFPNVEVLAMTCTYGNWANRVVSSEEEAKHLTDYFLNTAKVTYPVGIWRGKQVVNEDEGVTPEEWPNWKNYPMLGKPTIWIIDGNGRIRRIFIGYSRNQEAQMKKVVESLEREAAASRQSPVG
jgi:hypothetical protein